MSWWGDQHEDVVTNDALFLTDLILELYRREYQICSLQDDRDNGHPQFNSFMNEDRKKAYMLQDFVKDFPPLDILWVQWRWKMEGRNSGEGKHMNDYDRQTEILTHYHDNTNTKIFIQDSDQHLTKEDEERWNKARILTLATKPIKLSKDRISIFWPFDSRRLELRKKLVHAPWSETIENNYCLDPNFLISYIGNDYERQGSFERWIFQMSTLLAIGKVHVYGNWLKYPQKALENVQKYFPVNFHPKVNNTQMEYIYSRSLCVPLLAKDIYNKTGHMTFRGIEAMYCGSLPIGPAEFTDIGKYIIPELIVVDQFDFYSLIRRLQRQTLEQRIEMWEKQIKHFSYGPKEFVDVLEKTT